MRVRHTRKAASAVSSHKCQGAAALAAPLAPASTQAVASSRPITTGAIPCLKARTARRSRLRWPQRVAK
ncbi:hypothetical protein D3C84_1208440 [compost metagenome]